MFSILKLKNKSLTILKKDDTTLFCRVLTTKSTPHWAKDTTSLFFFVVFVVFVVLITLRVYLKESFIFVADRRRNLSL